MPVDVKASHVDAIPLAVIRRRVRQSELSKVVPEGCGIVWNFVKARQLKAGRNVAVYLNGDIDLEVGVEVAQNFEAEGEVVRSATPSGLAAFATHFGPYGGMGTTHQAILSWCNANGYELAGPSWEIYGHWLPEWNNNPSQIRTDIFYMVRR